ncbi:MAG: helix-turn-helix transcriptional regulator [Gammaproteobacteria bacterium]|nr:transcriptional regulator [Gammaproteobacteria bacterium]
MLSEDRRREIATFLRLRRERLQPEQVNLPRGNRRRTPGLRREEVAALAGVSTEWYTWLEQARDVQPSADTLRRIAAALRLEAGEAQHLLTLAGQNGEIGGNGQAHTGSVSPRVRRLLEQFGECPAWVHGERWDILAWNRAATVIHDDIETAQGFWRNGVYRMFTHERMREMLVDWERHARDIVAKLRVAHARYVDDPWFNELVSALRAQSDEFARWWNEHNVQLPQGGLKRYRHPEAGLLNFEFTHLTISGEPFESAHLVAYVPADNSTREKLMELLEPRAGGGRPIGRPSRLAS